MVGKDIKVNYQKKIKTEQNNYVQNSVKHKDGQKKENNPVHMKERERL